MASTQRLKDTKSNSKTKKNPNSGIKVFLFEDKIYLRVVPGKKLFNSTMIHEVVNRGDIFAVDMETQRLTIIPGTAVVSFADMKCSVQFGLEL